MTKMKLILGLMWCCIVQVCVSQSDQSATYAAHVPTTITAGENFTFTLHILPTVPNPVLVWSELEMVHGEFSMEIQKTLMQPGERSIITLEKVPVAIGYDARFELKITGYDHVTGDEVFSNTTKEELKMEQDRPLLFIETDKKVYKKGQTIKFRALCLSPQRLLPLNCSLTYEIRDPGRHVIMRRTRPTTRGLLSDELPLLSDATKGSYHISVEGEHNKASVEVEVDEYKLPKFEATLLAPSRLYRDASGATIKLIAKYTYGMPVKGTASILIISGRHKINKIFQDFVGEAEVVLSEEDVIAFDDQQRSNIVVKAKVVEKHTNIVERKDMKIDFLDRIAEVKLQRAQEIWKPGMDYEAYLKVTETGGTPLNELLQQQTVVTVRAELGIKHEYCTIYSDNSTHCRIHENQSEPSFVETFRYDDIPQDGVLPFKIDSSMLADIDFNLFKFTVKVDGASTGIDWTVEVQPSLQIQTDDSTAQVGETTTFAIRTTNLTRSVQITVMNRGRNVLVSSVETEEESTYFEYQLQVTEEMTPSISLLASYIKGELVVADHIQLPVAFHMQNKVDISTSGTTLKAGEDINIRIQASDPQSLIAIKAVDKSVGLLKTGNDITMDKVDTEQQRQLVKEETTDTPSPVDSVYSYYGSYYGHEKTVTMSEEAFKQAHLELLSDAGFYDNKIYDTSYEAIYEPMYYAYVYDEVMPPVVMADEVTYYHAEPGPEPVAMAVSYRTYVRPKKPRKFFPETWLWKECSSSDNGGCELNTKVPDTVTSWEIDAFAVSSSLGLGLAQTAEISVFQNFFINLNLPIRVIRGEIIIVQAIVFNYLPQDVEVALELHQSTNFELIVPGDDVTTAGPIRHFTVPARDSHSVWYPVRMTSLGSVEIRVGANGGFVFDSLIRTVRVDPEGLRLCFADSRLLTRADDEEDASEARLSIRVPEDVVEGSVISKLHIYGEMMGSTMSNLGDLLEVPTGCGEQNMLGFAPDVFVTLYLERTNRLTAEFRNTAYKHFVTGYQNQLRYKHYDGSYSAFGQWDDHGSLWLTAFVLKCFQHATGLEEGVSAQLHTSIADARRFILRQNENGYFKEPGIVYHASLQGGVNSKVTMTAYAVISLLEGNDRIEFQAEVAENKLYLEQNFDSIRNKTYDLAIVTHALHLLHSDVAVEALLVLESRAIVENDFKYWHENVEFSSSFKEDFEFHHRPPPSTDIEMTSYALLTYALRRDFANIQAVTRWLISKRNHLGAYDNTQDTVLAIQALTTAVTTLQSEQNLDVTFVSGDQQQMMNLNQDNFMIYNRFDLQATDHVVDVQASGTGVGVAQLSICYHVMETPYQDSPFHCSYAKRDMDAEDLDIARLVLTCRLKEGVNTTVGMLLYQINIPNGFKVDPARERRRNGNAKKIEFQKGSANFYYDGLPLGGSVQANVVMERYQKIAGSKPSTITVSDYYQPGRSSVLSYSFEKFEQSDACSVCGSKCAGCTTSK